MPALTFTEQLQRLLRKYRSTEEPGRFTMRNAARWAIDKGEWEPSREDVVGLLAKELSRAARLEHHRDPQGRSVRTYHAARVEEDGENLTLWDAMQTADRPHMEVSLKQRRQGIVGGCKQYKTDVDSYNDNYNPGDPFPCVLEFTDDVAELEALEGLGGHEALDDAEGVDD
jgi:hypothetical protein